MPGNVYARKLEPGVPVSGKFERSSNISEIDEKIIPINIKKATKFGLGVFQVKVLFLNIILRLNFTREAEIATLTRNNCQLPSLFTNFKIRYKNMYKDCRLLLH